MKYEMKLGFMVAIAESRYDNDTLWEMKQGEVKPHILSPKKAGKAKKGRRKWTTAEIENLKAFATTIPIKRKARHRAIQRYARSVGRSYQGIRVKMNRVLREQAITI